MPPPTLIQSQYSESPLSTGKVQRDNGSLLIVEFILPPFTRALQVVGNRWRPVLLWTMSKGISRYGEMRRAIPNISEKVLAYELRKLQSLGLIVKEVDKRERVTMTEYKLTERGFGVIPLLEHMES